jgi:hypothetical protein
MKKAKAKVADPDMRAEYDFTGAVRGKYFERYRESSNVVVLDPDVSEAFPNAASVNQALRVLASAARKSVGVKRVQRPRRGGRTSA